MCIRDRIIIAGYLVSMPESGIGLATSIPESCSIRRPKPGVGEEFLPVFNSAVAENCRLSELSGSLRSRIGNFPCQNIVVFN